MMNVHDTEGAGDNDMTAKYAGSLAIAAIIALVLIRTLMERK